MNGRVWHALIGDQEHGPISHAEVLAYLRNGTIDGDDLVWRPGFENWLPLREIQEFWRPPSIVRAPPPIPIEIDNPAAPEAEKWSLWGAAIAGLTLSAAALAMGALTKESYNLASYAHTPSADSMAYLSGYLLVGPLLFVIVAAIWNGVAGSKLRPSSAKPGWRALVFFAALIVIVASLKIYGELYFSRDEAISGEARSDIVNSFLTGCLRSQRNMAANTGATESQIIGYCNCIAPNLGSLTYKQIGASNALDQIRKAIEPVIPSCQAKR